MKRFSLKLYVFVCMCVFQYVFNRVRIGKEYCGENSCNIKCVCLCVCQYVCNRECEGVCVSTFTIESRNCKGIVEKV